MKRKIAIIDTLGAHGGSFHFYSFGQCIGLIKNEVNVSLYTNNETQNPNIKGLKFYRYYKDIFLSKSLLISGLRWIIGSVKSIFHARFNRVKIFHFHIFYTNILVLFNICLVKLLLGKVVLTIHDVASFSKKDSSNLTNFLVYKFASIILTHNLFSKSEIQIKNFISSSKIYIVPHGNYIPFIKIQKNQIKSRKHLNLPMNKKVLLFFGMIKEVKGLEILLTALKKIIVENPKIVLLIAGKPWQNNFSKYQKIIDKNNLSSYCILHTKFIDHSDVSHYYCASDLVILPYKKIYQSGVLMMALSYGKAVLTSDLSALKEVITDNKNGFLFNSEDSDSLAHKLNLILNNNILLNSVSRAGYKSIIDKYDWNNIGLLTRNAYLNID